MLSISGGPWRSIPGSEGVLVEELRFWRWSAFSPVHFIIHFARCCMTVRFDEESA
jgi:hypothetical protein